MVGCGYFNMWSMVLSVDLYTWLGIGKTYDTVSHVAEWDPFMHEFTGLHPFAVGQATADCINGSPVDGLDCGG